MNTMISFCGLDCGACPVYAATKENDDVKRSKVAHVWGKMFNMPLKPSDMNCDGCLSEGGRLFGHCNNCGIRKCGIERKVENCAHCSDYSCAQLDALLSVLPNKAPRENLEKIRKSF